MGKRTKEEIRKKIKRLQEKLSRRKSPSPASSPASSPDNFRYDGGTDFEYASYEMDVDSNEGVCGDANEEEIDITSECHNQVQSKTELPRPTASPAEGTSPQGEESIPPEILAMLGEAKTSEENFGKSIPSEVSQRWGKILVEGLLKEHKEMLLNKGLIPENFQLAKAPKLNAEVASVLNEPTKNCDKRLEKMQNQLGSGIAGLVYLTSELIGTDMTKIDIIKKLSEVTQILLDLHYEETMNRRRLIIPILDKSFLNVIQGVKRDNFLFGDNLGENIRASKSIEKSSLQIKKINPSQQFSRRPVNTGLQGNYRAPPRHASGQGAARPRQAQARYYPQPPLPPAARRPPPTLRRPPPPPPPPSRPQERRSRR